MNTQATALLPMQPISSLPTWLLMAAQVYAPQQVVLVGAGNGTGPLVQGLLTMQAMPQHTGMKAHLLEAHAPTLAQLAKRLDPDTTWQLSADVVLSANVDGNPTYHHYSLGTESSLLPPSDLQTLWPSLQLISEQPANSGVPINNLLNSLLPSPWLLLDCLPAAHLLQGVDLSHTHVLLTRVVLGAPDTSPSGSTLAQLQDQLGRQGYQLAACFAERNTQLAKTLWLRDPAWLQHQAKAKADQALSEQSKAHEAQANTMAQELQALQAELAAEVQARQDLQAQKAQALAKATELNKANEQSQTQLKAALSDLQQAKAHAEQLVQTHAQQLEKEKAQTDHVLSEQSKVHEVQVKSRAQELQALEAEKAEHLNQLAIAEQRSTEFNQAQAEFKQALALAAQHIDAASKDKEQAANQLQRSVAELDTHKKRSADLQKQVDASLNRLAKLQIAFQNLQAAAHTEAQHQNGLATPTNQALQSFQPKQLAEFNLGEAWAGNTVNTVIFRHHGIFTHQGHQFTSFYVDEKTLRFVCRRLLDNHITHYDLAGEYNPKDAHNSISMGVDRQGYLHVCFDHHATKLRYRRSLKPMSIDGWTDDLPMTGRHEDLVTYPTFILPRAGFPLTLLYRDGMHSKGSARLKYYNEKSQSWHDKPTPILSGADQKPWTSNAYWNHPAIGTDGSLHLSFVWRTGVLGDEQLVNNINIGYAWSPDNGHHWYTLQGQPYQAPITPTTAETIWPVPPGSNLINQCSMALDRFNRPHIVFYANDADGIPQYQHLRYDGKRWHHQTLSNRTQPFTLAGGGTLQIPISRPEVLIDHEDNALVIFRGDLTADRMSVTRLCAPLYAAADAALQTLSEQPLGFAEPLLDRERWRQNQKLTLLTQHNMQPNHDANPAFTSSVIGLCDFDL